MGIKQIEPIIDSYLKELKKIITPKKIIVFGSFASGKANSESDLDLLVISDDFIGKSTDERFSVLYQARLHPAMRKMAMDIFGVTQKEYISASYLTTLGEVKETGITVFSA